MKTTKTYCALLLAAIVSMTVLTGCINVEHEETPTRTSTTTTSVRPSVVSPSTTVQRTTTY